MKRVLIITGFLFTGFISVSYAKGFKGLSLGANVGYSNYAEWNGDGFVQADLQFGQIPFKPKLGLCYHPYYTAYADFDRLNVV